MAEFRGVRPQRANIGAAFQRGVNIAGQVEGAKQDRARTDIARQGLALQETAQDAALAKQADDAKIAAKDRVLDQNQKDFQTAVKLKQFGEADRILQDYNRLAGTNFQGNLEEMASFMKDHGKAEKAGDTEEEQRIENLYLKTFGQPISAGAELLGRTDIVESEAAERVLKEEEVAFGVKEERAGVTAGRVSGETVAATAALTTQKLEQQKILQKEVGDRVRASLTKLGLPDEQIEATILEAVGDISAGTAQRLFPQEEKTIIRTRKKIDPITFVETERDVVVERLPDGRYVEKKILTERELRAEEELKAQPAAAAPPATTPAAKRPIGIPSYLAEADQRTKDFFERLVEANEGRIPTEEEFNKALSEAEEVLKQESKQRVEESLPKVKLTEFIKKRSAGEQDFFKSMVRGSGIIPTEKEFNKAVKRSKGLGERFTIPKKIGAALKRATHKGK